jgi:flagellar protein FlaG
MEIKLQTQPASSMRTPKPQATRVSQSRSKDQDPSLESESAAPLVAEEEEDTMTARLKQAMEDLQQKYKMKVELDTDEETGRQVVRILSQDGERLVRQIPPQEALKLASRAWDDIRSHIVTWRG